MLQKLAISAGLLLLMATLSFAQNESWQIDSDRSTAQLSLIPANDSRRQMDLAVAMAAGTLRLDQSTIPRSSMRLSIFPGGQQASLLTHDGSFRNGGLAGLPSYTLISFRSDQAEAAGNDNNQVAFTGELTVVHVQRETNVDWNNAYSGPEPAQPVVNIMIHRVTFLADLSTVASNSSQQNGPTEITALATIDRNNFRGFFSALEQSSWPTVVINRRCEMPYYPALTNRDYSGPRCTGTPIVEKPLPEPHFYYAPNNIGTRVATGTDDGRVTIAVRMYLARAVSENMRGH